MKCFSKGSVIQSHCAKMREVICTQAKLAIYMLYICKNKAGKDIVQNIEQRRDTTTVLWVPMKLLILSENIYLRWLLYN